MWVVFALTDQTLFCAQTISKETVAFREKKKQIGMVTISTHPKTFAKKKKKTLSYEMGSCHKSAEKIIVRKEEVLNRKNTDTKNEFL